MQTEFKELFTKQASAARTVISKPRQVPETNLAGRRFSKPRCIATSLGICPRTLFRWANAGKITRHKINARVVLFDEAEVVAFIDASRVGNASPMAMNGPLASRVA